MNKDQQLAFIAKELDRVKTKASGYVLIDKIPESWTPMQIRQFLVDEMNYARVPTTITYDMFGNPNGRTE